MLTSRLNPTPVSELSPEAHRQAVALPRAVAAGDRETVERLLAAGASMALVTAQDLDAAGEGVLAQVLDAAVLDIDVWRTLLRMDSDAGLRYLKGRLSLPDPTNCPEGSREGLLAGLMRCMRSAGRSAIDWLRPNEPAFARWLAPLSDKLQFSDPTSRWMDVRHLATDEERQRIDANLMRVALESDDVGRVAQLALLSADPDALNPWRPPAILMAKFCCIPDLMAQLAEREISPEWRIGWCTQLASRQPIHFGIWLEESPATRDLILAQDGWQPEWIMERRHAYLAQNLVKALVAVMTPEQVGACVRSTEELQFVIKTCGRTDMMSWLPHIRVEVVAVAAMDLLMEPAA